MTERREEMHKGYHMNATEHRPVLHHVLRMRADYPLMLQSNTPLDYRQRPSPRQGFGMSLKTEPHKHHRPNNDPLSSTLNGPELLGQVHQLREKVREFSEGLRSGAYRSITGQNFFHIICIGGGDLMGPQFVAQALQADPAAAKACQDRKLRFLSNVDPVDFFQCTRDLDPSKTLAIVISKSFDETETVLNARTVQN